MFNTCKDKEVQKSASRTYEELIGGKYKVGKKIGSGAYGQIRVGTDVQTGQTVAIKFESMNSKDLQLMMENQIYQLLRGKKGFPSIYLFCRYMDHHVLVMEMLGRNLDSVFECLHYKFSLKSIIFLTLQLLKRFETIHQVKILYRDVKPENFMLGVRTNTVYVIDFGLSKSYVDSAGRHIQPHATHEIIGTARYMSVSAHLCREQGRKDDLEALGYVFLYFLRGKLPWSGLKADGFKEHNRMICELKRDTPEEDLCAGYPQEYMNYLKYVRALGFEDTPDYEKLRNMFKRLFHLQGMRDDGVYDWNC